MSDTMVISKSEEVRNKIIHAVDKVFTSDRVPREARIDLL